MAKDLIAPLAVIACVLGGLLFARPALANETAKVDLPPYPEKGLKGLVKAERLPVSENPVIQQGASVWDKNCRVCHGTGLAGAPKITGSKFWAPRIEQGLSTLVAHAVDGFLSPDGGSMPAKGGNKELSDTEVEAAVRFMIYHSGGAEIAVRDIE